MPEKIKLVKTESFGAALDLLLLVRKQGMKASYWPNGGDKDAKHSSPVIHQVAVLGSPDSLAWVAL